MSMQNPSLDTLIFQTVCKSFGLVSLAAMSFFFAVFLTSMVFFIVDKPEVLETTYTPDGKLKAVVFSGPKLSVYKNVSVINAKAQLEKDRDGNVFSIACKNASAKWLDNHNLVVYCNGDSSSGRMTEHFVAFDRDIQIEYRALKGE